MAGSRRTRAFTLVEVLVVLVIIGILAGLIVPRLLRHPGRAKRTVAVQQITQLENMLSVFKLETGRYPTAAEGLDALLEAPEDVTEEWAGPYCKEKDLLDPWKQRFNYEYPGTHNEDGIDVWTYGADGVEGGEGENGDLGNW